MLVGVPKEIMSAEEFPEDPDVRAYRITGNFTAEYGDYRDLKRIRSDLFRGMPVIPLF
jgi:hypothetical protein